MLLTGRTVIVTGAGNGLGRAQAVLMARLGASVVVNDVGITPDGTGSDTNFADEVVEEIRSSGGSAVASIASVATTDGADSIIQTALDAFGSIDSIVANAGIIRNGAFTDLTTDDYQKLWEVHVLGAMYVTQRAFPIMAKSGRGRIVFVTSPSGIFGNVNQSSYATAKAGIVGLANVAAIEGAQHGILVNTFSPSQGGGSRMGGQLSPETLERLRSAENISTTPAQMAPLVAALCSDQCTFTKRTFSFVQGRIAEVFIGVTEGWRPPNLDTLTANDILAHADAIGDRTNYAVPKDLMDEAAHARRTGRE